MKKFQVTISFSYVYELEEKDIPEDEDDLENDMIEAAKHEFEETAHYNDGTFVVTEVK